MATIAIAFRDRLFTSGPPLSKNASSSGSEIRPAGISSRAWSLSAVIGFPLFCGAEKAAPGSGMAAGAGSHAPRHKDLL